MTWLLFSLIIFANFASIQSINFLKFMNFDLFRVISIPFREFTFKASETNYIIKRWMDYEIIHFRNGGRITISFLFFLSYSYFRSGIIESSK